MLDVHDRRVDFETFIYSYVVEIPEYVCQLIKTLYLKKKKLK